MICYVRTIVAILLLINLCQANSIPNAASSMSLMSAEAEDLSSIEIPVRKQRSGQPQHRPIVELVLGVLDTFHSSAKSELNRIKARHARANQAYEAAMAMMSTTETPKSLFQKFLPPTPRKRLVTPRI
ncbi:uncharacterized protein LOC100678377 [Nasonia vitripennis]|uniref:Uncharacterized protein n=1 Tax=Nasonia vitripennis TaxID=7425 RepID=A0A7M7HFK7_NASVI|nr:uncharacterized protein LOC100678377 [Nasonia vitripennis]XP_008213374.1 uncharacterized protein LOC100678377 [Nasonia vitripennis]